MIVCWVLFAITTIASSISFFSLSEDWERNRAELIIEAGIPDPETCKPSSEQALGPGDIQLKAEVFEDLEKQRSERCGQRIRGGIERLRLNHIGIYKFVQFTSTTGVMAAGILLLIFVCYATNRIFTAENNMLNKIKENWRPFMVLATVIWGVVFFGNEGFYGDDEKALVLGPFVIAIAIFFLFPKRKS